MKFFQENLYHVYNRGNLSNPIFFDKENYFFFLKKMKTHLSPYCEILAWCLMPNHFHWVIYVKKQTESKSHKSILNSEPVEELNKSIGILLRSYTRAVNKKYKKQGSLFQQKTKSKNLNRDISSKDDYPLTCFLYIHQNPLRAGLENYLGEWEFSSYKDYIGARNGQLCNIQLARELLDLPEDSRLFDELSSRTIDEDKLKKLF
ncbi:MAG: hypothetical protein JJU37_11760 [Balneolaceae bacterium]|nr:hypothetical protein [Balneolaceae bacterium]